jgi:O-antigen/teichoic acid export membrane protein
MDKETQQEEVMGFENFSKRLVTKNIAINLLGNIIPMAAAIVTIPYVIANIGNEKFGVLTIAWLFLGYFSILDLGIGRATTKFVIEYYNKGLVKEVQGLIWTSILSLFFFGVFIGGILLLCTPLLTNTLLNIPDYLRPETQQSLYLIAASIPFVVGVSVARGVLEAQQKFFLLNVIKIPSSILNYLIPAIVGFFTESLTFIILLLAITRVILFLIHLYFCLKPFHNNNPFKNFHPRMMKELMQYGGWITVSNLIGPIMIYFDRFIIGSILTLTMLTYYTTPYEVITKLLVIAGSATGVLFPVFANLFLVDKVKLQDLYEKSLKAMLLIMMPMCLFFCLFSYDVLYLWLGEEFAKNSSIVLQLLSMGILFNSIASIPYALILAGNRPDISAKAHLLELPFYLLALILLASQLGIAGVALAWMLRTFIDAFIFLYVSNNLQTAKSAVDRKRPLLLLLLIFFFFTVSFVLPTTIILTVKIPLFLFMLLVFSLISWLKVLSADERGLIQKILGKKI